MLHIEPAFQLGLHPHSSGFPELHLQMGYALIFAAVPTALLCLHSQLPGPRQEADAQCP